MKKQRVKMLNKMRTEASKFVSLCIVDLHVGEGGGQGHHGQWCLRLYMY